MKTKQPEIVEWEKEFNLMWERDFSEPSKGNPDQWIMLSPIKYKDFISKALQSQADKTRREVIERRNRELIIIMDEVERKGWTLNRFLVNFIKINKLKKK
jgi:hypothetical protein